jgi:hypothetical protein
MSESIGKLCFTMPSEKEKGEANGCPKGGVINMVYNSFLWKGCGYDILWLIVILFLPRYLYSSILLPRPTATPSTIEGEF